MGESAGGEMIQAFQAAAEIKQRAREIGFDLVGIAPSQRSARADYVRQWLNENQHGTMQWMEKRFDERVDPSVYMAGAKSVICVGLNYHAKLASDEAIQAEQTGRIARYALGDDYHELIKQRLHLLADWMRWRWEGIETRACVDTAPVMEKDLAARAGLGWIGKNTCLINEKIGSWVFLGEVVTSLELPVDQTSADHCGTCTRCIDACPTRAITEPYKLDARKCISYLTIEHRTGIDPALRGGIGDWIYGCDICQEVCPHNRRAPETEEPAFRPRFENGRLNLEDVDGWGAEEYRNRLRGSAMKRVKLSVLQRNAGIARENGLVRG